MLRNILRNPLEIEVKFNEAEVLHLRTLAEKFQAPKERVKANDRRIIDRDNVKTHLIGLLGQYALSRWLGIEFDDKAYISGAHKKPMELFGVTIDVKTLQGYLTYPSLDHLTDDLAVLCIYEKSNYGRVWLQGFIPKFDFRQMHFTDNFGYGERPCMQPVNLIPVHSLKGYCLQVRNLRFMERNND